MILLNICLAFALSLSPLITTLGWPGALNLKDFVCNGRSKSKSSSLASTLPLSKLVFGIVNDPDCPLKYPAGFGISLILKVETDETRLPSGNVPDTLIYTSLPFPGNKLYLLPLTLFNPRALALTLLSIIPGIDIVIGFCTPL